MEKQSKKNLILGGILAILLVAVYLYQGPLQDNKQEGNNFLSGLETDNINRMKVISSVNGTTTLIRDGERWKIGDTKDFYTKRSVAEDLNSGLEKLLDAEFELISANDDKKSNFNTNKEKGVEVVFYQNDEKLGEVIIGKLASDFISTYVSKDDMEGTYAAKDVNLVTLFHQEDWRSDIIFDSPKDDITKVRFQYGDDEFVVERKVITGADGATTTKWSGTSPYSFEVDPSNISEVLDVMSELTAAKIPEQTFEGTELEEHSIIVEVTGDSVNNTIMVGGEAEEQGDVKLYYAKKASSDNIYLITDEEKNILDTSIQELR